MVLGEVFTREILVLPYGLDEGDKDDLWGNQNEHQKVSEKKLSNFKITPLRKILWLYQLEWAVRSHKVSTPEFQIMNGQILK